MAQTHLGATYNRQNFDLINNYTYGTLRSLSQTTIVLPTAFSIHW